MGTPYRAEHIVESLPAKKGLIADDYAAIRGDQRSAQARELLPVLLAIRPQTPKEKQALDILEK